MTPQEKAKELVEKFKAHSYYEAHDLTTRTQREQSNIESAVECALICVDETIDSYSQYKDMYDQGAFDAEKQYWNDVKKQIELL